MYSLRIIFPSSWFDIIQIIWLWIIKGPYLNTLRTHLQRALGDDNVLIVKFVEDTSCANIILEEGILVGLRRYRFFGNILFFSLIYEFLFLFVYCTSTCYWYLLFEISFSFSFKITNEREKTNNHVIYQYNPTSKVWRGWSIHNLTLTFCEGKNVVFDRSSIRVIMSQMKYVKYIR